MVESFDIFISYKRKSLPTANNLYYRLTTRGYSTFFDLEEMGRDNFNVQLLNYIENAKDVFVILEEGALDACRKENWEEDWFCHEIAFALEKKKNIIPILIGGYKMHSQDFFPDKLKELCLKNAPEFNFSFFEAYLDKLIEKEYLDWLGWLVWIEDMVSDNEPKRDEEWSPAFCGWIQLRAYVLGRLKEIEERRIKTDGGQHTERTDDQGDTSAVRR
jgi:hypothetical protein